MYNVCNFVFVFNVIIQTNLVAMIEKLRFLFECKQSIFASFFWGGVNNIAVLSVFKCLLDVFFYFYKLTWYDEACNLWNKLLRIV